MSKMLRYTEAEFHARTLARVSRQTPAEEPKPKPAPGIPGQDAAKGSPAARGCLDEPTPGQEDSLVMLPYPISANRYWRNFRGRMVVSSEARAYKTEVAGAFDSVDPIPETWGVALSIKLHPKLTTKGVASRTIIDLDNCIKVCLDALQGVLYVNDRQVKHLLAEVGEPVLGGGLSVGAVAC